MVELPKYCVFRVVVDQPVTAADIKLYIEEAHCVFKQDFPGYDEIHAVVDLMGLSDKLPPFLPGGL